ncbi:hypothetical protein F183_A27550 [Bryobacterales bacterium F-183]|nr:hypothetical protein F183_A27550 [Bryobacterales bacterium F-183]
MAEAMILHRRSLLLTPFLLAGQTSVPVRAITKGPKFHWFGYYDKLQIDPGNRLVLGNQVDFEHRSPGAEDVIQVGFVDTAGGKDTWHEIGTTRAWNWQQGCMLQWIPGSREEVLWNDRVDGQFVAHIHNVRTGKRRTIGSPVYTLSPDGKWGLVCDFPRLNHTRPGYGYAGLADPNREVAAPENSGIWKVDLATGKRQLLFSIADIAKIPNREPYSKGAVHWFNHLLASPDGKRFIFLHRWRGEKEGKSFSTRMFTADSSDGGKLYVADPYGKTSHFIWRDPQHIAAWAWHPSHGDKFYLYRDRTEQVDVIGKDTMTVNGHLSYLPGRRSHWILNDTYPDKERMQNPFLFDTRDGRKIALGRFLAPPEYTGEWRCDTHPRISPDGNTVIIDSAHGGNGRQMYAIDIAALTR